MRKTGKLYQRLYAFLKRTGSPTDLQRPPPSVDREVDEPVGGRAGHREAGAIGQEPTSGLEPLTQFHYECAVSGCQALHGFCKYLIGKRFPLPYLARYCRALHPG
jgi:hypothetical protein